MKLQGETFYFYIKANTDVMEQQGKFKLLFKIKQAILKQF